MADKNPSFADCPGWGPAEKISVHKSDRKKSLYWTVLPDNL